MVVTVRDGIYMEMCAYLNENGMVGIMVGNVCRVQGPGSRSKYGNLCKNSQKIRKNLGMVVMMVGNIFRVKGPVPNMVIYPKIATKYPKSRKKLGDGAHCFVMMLRNICRVQGPFPNKVIYRKMDRYSPKNQKKI